MLPKISRTIDLSQADRLPLPSTKLLCALCCSDCAASRALRTRALDPARLRSLSCAAAWLRQSQAFVSTFVFVFFFICNSYCRCQFVHPHRGHLYFAQKGTFLLCLDSDSLLNRMESLCSGEDWCSLIVLKQSACMWSRQDDNEPFAQQVGLVTAPV